MKKKLYKNLIIPIIGKNNIQNTSNTQTGLQLANGYNRVVIGERGPYVEFQHDHLYMTNLFVPEKEQWRLDPTNSKIYYHEYRSIDDAYVKVYYQLKTVAYADYKIGLYYISPFDLYYMQKRCAEPI